MSVASRSDRRVALVTGAGGFTGRFVSQALTEAGFDVVGWTHAGGAGNGLRSVELRDAASVREAVVDAAPDVVVHLAAIAFVAHGDADELYRVNLMGTRHLLGALASLEAVPHNVILASSANVYGNAEGRLGEDTPPSPQNDYAVSKLAMEHMAHLWTDRLPITITRPFNYTGVGQGGRFLIPKIVSHFRAKASTIELGNLDVWREFNDVRDVAQIYARLAARVGSGEVFNLCSGVEHSLRDVLVQMETISAHALGVRINPDFVRANEVFRLRGDDSRLCSALGALPRRPLSDTLRWMYESAA
ncbi:NAD-dependent epimerase/dehydratase family protein [Lysobacter sp. HA18]